MTKDCLGLGSETLLLDPKLRCVILIGYRNELLAVEREVFGKKHYLGL
jgi:hypothetical protein